MKIGCNTWSFHRDVAEERLPLEGFLSIEYEGAGDETQGVKEGFELLKRFLK